MNNIVKCSTLLILYPFLWVLCWCVRWWIHFHIFCPHLKGVFLYLALYGFKPIILFVICKDTLGYYIRWLTDWLTEASAINYSPSMSRFQTIISSWQYWQQTEELEEPCKQRSWINNPRLLRKICAADK